MTRWAITLGLLALAAPAVAQRDAPQECARAEAIVRYGAQGYDHWVRVHNECEHAVLCDVSTDVNPSAETALVPAGGSRDVLTFRGSPARTFVPRLECHRSTR